MQTRLISVALLTAASANRVTEVEAFFEASSTHKSQLRVPERGSGRTLAASKMIVLFEQFYYYFLLARGRGLKRWHRYSHYDTPGRRRCPRPARARLRLPGRGGAGRGRAATSLGARQRLPGAAMAAGGLCSAAAAARAVSRGWRGAATLAVHPAAGLADEAVETRALGLSPRQAVTLRALATAELGGSLFASCAHYEADAGGRLELARAAALGGDFRGLEPMGLFWSLAPAALEPPYRRLVPRGLRPLCVDLLLHDGHSPAGALPGPLLARARLERCFTAPGVRRVRLKEGRVRGSLFLPAGEGRGRGGGGRGHSHPGVLRGA